jgi:hypothetical protein
VTAHLNPQDDELLHRAIAPSAWLPLWVIFDRVGEFCRPPTSASPRKLTSGPYGVSIAMGQEETFALQQKSHLGAIFGCSNG